ncbi:MAG: FAD/NAD(P)-binding protein [Candidatus Omnitrophota bacterium]|nr:FAD/NAD(P)-binding protein [Candidatus Omnitrophota bacterium]
MKNEYFPKIVVIENIVNEAPDVKTFTLRLKHESGGKLKYKPGQFMMLSLPGYGEAPFTFASRPASNGRFQITVKKLGSLTAALHDLREKDAVGIRGPYGNSFPLDKIENKDLLFVAGGIGMAPLRSLIQQVFKNRKNYGNVEIVYGSRSPRELVYKDEIISWQDNPDTDIHLTVDTPDETWGGACGVVCALFPKVKLDPKTSVVILCGPPVMIKSAIKDILKLGFRDSNIYASLERHMKCGAGKCGHCYIKGKYVCLDGPNFSYLEMKKLEINS